MAVLGFIATPPTPITYDAFRELAQRANAYGRSLEAARAAAQFALLRSAGVVVGGGLFGYAIGQAIMDRVSQETAEIPVRQLYKVPGGQGLIRVRATVTLQGVGELNFENDFPSPVVMPIALDGTGGTFRYGALVGENATFVGYFQAAPDQQLSPFRVISVQKVNGDPANFQKIPAPALPLTPYQPIKVPALIPSFPGEPDFPITPTVVPAPENDPDEDNKQGEPGVIVQIPELGTQIKFTPTGVTIGRYKSPETEPTEEPRVPFPPNTQPPASDVCPCPEDKGKFDEIICRIKTLQDELLDNGYDTETFLRGASSFTQVDGLPDEFFRLEISVSQTPSNVKTQFYSAPEATVTWVGWLSWNFGSRKSERIFLQFTEMGFSPPPGCTGYTIAMNSGCQASSLALTRKKKDYIDLCGT